MSAEQPGDETLVRRIQAGDAEALVVLYRRYVGPVYRFVYVRTGDRDDAEDVTSSTFLQMVRGINGFRQESAFQTWLFQIARNQVRDHWRTRRRQQQLEVDLATLAGKGRTSVQLEDGYARPGPPRAVHQLAQRIMAQLPARYRRVLELRFLDGRSVRDTAREMGISEGNAKVLQHRALKRAALLAARSGEA